jgi:hypothetical protein
MPRLNKTFSDKDVIRIWVKHLTVEEQIIVAQFIDENLLKTIEKKLGKINDFLIDILQFRDIIQPLLDAIAFIPGVGTVVDIIEKIFDDIEDQILESAKKTKKAKN